MFQCGAHLCLHSLGAVLCVCLWVCFFLGGDGGGGVGGGYRPFMCVCVNMCTHTHTHTCIRMLTYIEVWYFFQ